MNCHQCEGHITAAVRSEVDIECGVYEAIFCSMACFEKHAVEMVKKETQNEAQASKEKRK